jgi:hypothetical protein
MKSLRQSIASSWIPELRLIPRSLAPSLGLPSPLSLSELARHLSTVEERRLSSPIDADALHGDTELVVRSDGSYTFRGHVTATGFPSFSYKLQATLTTSGGAVVVIEASGRVFGHDTPGHSSSSWDEGSISPQISRFWPDLRNNAVFTTDLEKNLIGTTGAIVDVAVTVIELYVAAQFRGLIGVVIVLGVNLGSVTGTSFIKPNIAAGITVGAGVLLIFGPAAILPALAAGTGTVLLADIRSRPMNEFEIIMARQVFKDKLPIDEIIITDMYNPNDDVDNGIAREFTIPSIDGTYLVNMGKNYDHTLEADVQGRKNYAKPGELLIHELMHVWQMKFAHAVPVLLCKSLVNSNYDYGVERVAAHVPFGKFGPEEQASIVDDWFGSHDLLESEEALRDPKFLYIEHNVRNGIG